MAQARPTTTTPSWKGYRRGDAVLPLAIVMLPLMGGLLAGRSTDMLFRFPPVLQVPQDYLKFSWLAFAGVMVALAAIIGPWLVRRHIASNQARPAGTLIQSRRLPSWGWVALGWTGIWWWLAWTRWDWFAAFQQFTFFPLWLGFIVTVNALTERRVGTCLLRRAPVTWLTLFAWSALFWWGFEWLNRFVENWHYLGVEDFTAPAYALNASLCFSTVLPAVAAVSEWLHSHPGWQNRMATGPRWPWLSKRGTGWILLAGGALALTGAGNMPQVFYAALWVAPLALFLGVSILRGTPGLALEVARGDWQRAATWMVAALICGFFWELWNWHSLARWIYTVPGVDRWHVFEMPIAGYAGYLPFGLECLLVAERVIGRDNCNQTDLD